MSNDIIDTRIKKSSLVYKPEVLPVNDSWVSNDDVCTLFVDGHGLRRVGNLKINVELIYVVKSIIADPVQRLLKYSHG